MRKLEITQFTIELYKDCYIYFDRIKGIFFAVEEFDIIPLAESDNFKCLKKLINQIKTEKEKF